MSIFEDAGLRSPMSIDFFMIYTEYFWRITDFSSRIFSANHWLFVLRPSFQNPPILYKPFCCNSIIFPNLQKWPSPILFWCLLLQPFLFFIHSRWYSRIFSKFKAIKFRTKPSVTNLSIS